MLETFDTRVISDIFSLNDWLSSSKGVRKGTSLSAIGGTGSKSSIIRFFAEGQ